MSRPLYASDSYPQCKQRRLRRIQRAASQRLWEAFQEGQLSLHATEAIARKFGPTQQNRWLEKELERRRRKSEGQILAASVINELLGAGVFDLSRIGMAIRAAIRSNG
jgi:hypothetical protein